MQHLNVSEYQRLKSREKVVLGTISRNVSDFILLSIALSEEPTVHIELASVVDLSPSPDDGRIAHDNLEAAKEVQIMITKQLEVLKKSGHLEKLGNPEHPDQFFEVTPCANHNFIWELKPTQNLRNVLTQFRKEQ